MRRALLVATLMLVPACGDRPVPVDGGPLPDAPRPSSDRRHAPPDWSPSQIEWALRLDACGRPPGYCHSEAECPAGQQCQGCFPDPCCPMCDVCIGKCTPVTPGGCTSNAQCAGTQFCNLDGKCGVAGSLGQCQARPSGCPKIYSPVCGCDGKTYGNDCDAHSSGVSVAFKGKCCKDLEAEYVSLVQAAKKCCALCGTVDSCTMIVNNQLSCPCPTVINAIAPEVSQIKALAQQWGAQGCTTAACPPVPCMKVAGGSCQPAPGGSGLCTDKVIP